MSEILKYGIRYNEVRWIFYQVEVRVCRDLQLIDLRCRAVQMPAT